MTVELFISNACSPGLVTIYCQPDVCHQSWDKLAIFLFN